MDTSRKSRNRAACRRCQRRKIRCDGERPSCGSCRKANIPCINDGKQVVHRSYIASMEKRIQWLESLVKETSPATDLTQGPSRENPSGEPGNEDHDEWSILSPQRDTGLEKGHESEREHVEQPISGRDVRTEPRQAHEIGLVSLSPGGEPRYIGPSSGYFFANLVFSSAGRRQQGRHVAHPSGTRNTVSLATELLHTPAFLPPRRESTMELSSQYFKTTHIVYPFLHEPSHMDLIEQMYSSENVNPLTAFHVFMVLAIAASDLSRRSKMHLPAEGYYSTAMEYFNQFCPDGSLAGLQSLLLLMVYALQNPSCGINIWNVNYQCLASLIDLGVQRDIRMSPYLKMSLLEQEMRTRVFWVVYTFDRTIGTMMGRPVGVRDEACELRLPLDISDEELLRQDAQERNPDQVPSHITFDIHLFKLARLNSEIKYVMHSICRDTPVYAYPPIRDIHSWQQDMQEQLRTWKSEIPQSNDTTLSKLCEIRYNEIMILLLRPAPAIPEPSEESAVTCFHHAMSLLDDFKELYKNDSLQYSRLVVHSIFLGTLVVLHSIWKLPEIAAKVQIDELSANLTGSLNILSSIGEYWLDAQRARDCLEEISSITMKRLVKTRCRARSPSTPHLRPRRAPHATQNTSTAVASPHVQLQHDLAGEQLLPSNNIENANMTYPGTGFSGDPFGDLDGMNLFGDSALETALSLTGVPDFDGLMWEFFNAS